MAFEIATKKNTTQTDEAEGAKRNRSAFDRGGKWRLFLCLLRLCWRRCRQYFGRRRRWGRRRGQLTCRVDETCGWNIVALGRVRVNPWNLNRLHVLAERACCALAWGRGGRARCECGAAAHDCFRPTSGACCTRKARYAARIRQAARVVLPGRAGRPAGEFAGCPVEGGDGLKLRARLSRDERDEKYVGLQLQVRVVRKAIELANWNCNSYVSVRN